MRLLTDMSNQTVYVFDRPTTMRMSLIAFFTVEMYSLVDSQLQFQCAMINCKTSANHYRSLTTPFMDIPYWADPHSFQIGILTSLTCIHKLWVSISNILWFLCFRLGLYHSYACVWYWLTPIQSGWTVGGYRTTGD